MHLSAATSHLVVLIALILAQHVIEASWLQREDKICDPFRKNKLIPYTGFRLHRQYTFGRPVLHHQRLTHCTKGRVDIEAYLPVDRETDIRWGEDMCMDNNLCYRAVRSKKYAARSISLYVPETIVGGLFQCPMVGECTNENAVPVLPLIADKLGQQWYELPRLNRVVQRIPFFYTPSFVDTRYPQRPDRLQQWAQTLDINEQYEYSVYERLQIARAASKLLNTVHGILRIDTALLPWEVDLVMQELERDFTSGEPRQGWRHGGKRSIDIMGKLAPAFAKMAPFEVNNWIKELQTPLEQLQLAEPSIQHGTL